MTTDNDKNTKKGLTERWIIYLYVCKFVLFPCQGKFKKETPSLLEDNEAQKNLKEYNMVNAKGFREQEILRAMANRAVASNITFNIADQIMELRNKRQSELLEFEKHWAVSHRAKKNRSQA